MVGIGRPVVVLHVAGRARATGQVVVPVDVALCTWQRGVRSGQGEAGASVIKSGIAPGSCVVAGLAVGGELGLHMVGIVGAVVVLHVTGTAGVAGQVVVSVDVALRALQPGMASGKREAHRIVIETGRLPRARAVAGLAGLGEVTGHMVGIGGFPEVI